MGGFWLAEGYYAFARLDYRKWGHARTNLALLGLVLLINAGFGLATLGAFRWLRPVNLVCCTSATRSRCGTGYSGPTAGSRRAG